MSYETGKFKLYLKGLSDDYRTNKWVASCKKCDKWFDIPTTMMAVQYVECPKCREGETINYNNL